MELSRVGQRFRQKMRTLEGRNFEGSILSPSLSNSNNAGFLAPRRLLKVNRNEAIAPKDIIVSQAGRLFLCMDNGEGELDGIDFKSFSLIEVDRNLSWSRTIMVQDPVTKLNKTSTEQDLGDIWCALEPLSPTNDMMKVPELRYRLVTNSPLIEKDKIDGRLVVQRCEQLLGVYVAEVR